VKGCKCAMRMWTHKVCVRVWKGGNTGCVFVFASALATPRDRMQMCDANVLCKCAMQIWNTRRHMHISHTQALSYECSQMQAIDA